VQAGFNFLYILVSSAIFEQGMAYPDTRAVTILTTEKRSGTSKDDREDEKT
jgi:hypothetical protein